MGWSPDIPIFQRECMRVSPDPLCKNLFIDPVNTWEAMSWKITLCSWEIPNARVDAALAATADDVIARATSNLLYFFIRRLISL
jgi:hypothetical protein